MTTDTDTLLEHPPQACKPLEGALQIPVSLITPCPLNPRKRWKTAKVTEMEDDLRTNRQIQPIRVRPNPQHTASNGRAPYEIVVGETRWRAAPGAGLSFLDAIVADCSDQQLIQLALSENTKRQDLHPLEEADGFDALLRKPDGLQGYATVQELAAGLGVSPSYVYQRLKLRALCPAGREAFLDGKFDAGVALLIARMPSQEEQARATARIMAGWGGEAYSYRAAAEYLQKEFMLRLDLARFDTSAVYQVAGPCADCPKRSGAAPDLFADVTRGDMCQDARCYQAKVEEAHQALLQVARDAGRQVLQGSAARKVLPTPGGEPVGHYRLDAPCPALSDSRRTLREVLGTTFARHIVVLDLADQAPVELVPVEVASKALKARNLLREASPVKKAAAPVPADTKPSAPLWPDATPAQGAAAAPAAGPLGKGGAGGEGKIEVARRETEDAQLRTEARLAQQRFGELLFAELAENLRERADLPTVVLRLVVQLLFADVSLEGAVLLYGARGWDADSVAIKSTGFDKDFNARLAEASGRDLGELLALVLVAEDLSGGTSPGYLRDKNSPAGPLADACGIDLQRVFRDARAAAHAQVFGEAGGDESAAGAARRELTPNEAFVQQHGAATTAAAGKASVRVKYRCPLTGSTWTGRGLQPTWLKVALGRGQHLADFETTPAAGTASGTSSTADERSS